MPTYEYECQTCKRRAEAIRKISERNPGPQCECGDIMEQRIFTGRAFVAPDWNMNYKCVATGAEVTSERQRKQIMKENGLVDAREFDAPDFEALEEEQQTFLEEAEKPMHADVPDELKDALVREGKGTITQDGGVELTAPTD